MQIRQPLLTLAALAPLAVLVGMATSQAVAQPAADPLPDGPAKALVMRACASCHDIHLVIAKSRPSEQWDATVSLMVSRGANITDAEQDEIVAYLGKNFGAPAATPPSPPK